MLVRVARNHTRAWYLLAFASAFTLSSCAAPRRGPAVPVELADRATVLSMPAIRTWGNTLNPAFREEVLRAARRELDNGGPAARGDTLPPACYLAISGGGADGAYGAGLLCGWTAAGTRPEFKVVTGISTGALTAPFALLGPKYDGALRKVYTSITTRQIARPRGFLAALSDDALMDTRPLRQLMQEMVTDEMMRDIAREYGRGRLLLVGTTNLDAGRGVVWNIGAIAASGDPRALDLIHSVLLASAAIPGAFPPIMIDVQADGRAYQEMHVDGGVRAQVFLYPPSFDLRSRAASEALQRDRVAYVIRNARLDPTWESVPRRTLPIAGRAISSLIQTQGFGDLFRIYQLAQRDGVDFNLAFIPAAFQDKPREEFDPVYMSKLFDAGHAAARCGYPWAKTPPGMPAEEAPAASPLEPKGKSAPPPQRPAGEAIQDEAAAAPAHANRSASAMTPRPSAARSVPAKQRASGRPGVKLVVPVDTSDESWSPPCG